MTLDLDLAVHQYRHNQSTTTYIHPSIHPSCWCWDRHKQNPPNVQITGRGSYFALLLTVCEKSLSQADEVKS